MPTSAQPAPGQEVQPYAEEICFIREERAFGKTLYPEAIAAELVMGIASSWPHFTKASF